MNRFTSLTVTLPIINETRSLEETVEIISATCPPEDINEYLIIYCNRTTPESIGVAHRLAARLGDKCVLYKQKLPFIGGAMREAFDLARGSHVVMMSTDLETDPALIQVFIAEAKKTPEDIITASRWIRGGGFKDYHRAKLLLNWVFQKMFAVVYGCRLTDLTYAFRIFPTPLVQAIAWEELRHPFFLETALKPLRLGVRIREVPAWWKARSEGASQNPFWYNFVYFRIALRVRFRSPNRLLRRPSGVPPTSQSSNTSHMRTF
jgi:glycosyltransferase involved in cell wall biosynthesis